LKRPSRSDGARLGSPPSRPSAVLFDLDGTLVDSRRDIAEACNAALAAHGLASRSFETIMAMVGDGARVLVMRAFEYGPTDARLDEAVATYNRIYLASSHAQTVLLPGVQDVLDVCAEARWPCGIVTNKQRDVTLAVLAALEITALFPAIHAGDDGALKPDPGGVRGVVARLGVAAAEAWMIGDGPQDIEAGRAAGCFTIGVPGIAERERLAASAPDLLCESMVELAALLRRVLPAALTARRV
jgi:phosphoglycolate phosphatase